MAAPTKLFIVYYSMYGHIEKMAEEIKRGAQSIEDVEVHLFQVPETLPDEVLKKMHAPAKNACIPAISAAQLIEADGFLFGFPTRYGMMAAQFKAFLDTTGGLWRTQALAGKPAGIFVSTGTQGGGQETTAYTRKPISCPLIDNVLLSPKGDWLTAITQLVHHGMIFVPTGYTGGPVMFDLKEPKGGSPYGSGTFAGDGSRQPTKLELEQAFHQGKYTASVVKKLKLG